MSRQAVDVEKINRQKTIQRQKTLETKQKSLDLADVNKLMKVGGLLNKKEDAFNLVDPENLEDEYDFVLET